MQGAEDAHEVADAEPTRTPTRAAGDAPSSSKSSRPPRSFILWVGLAAGFGFLVFFFLPFAVVVDVRRRRCKGARDDLPSHIPTSP